MPWFVNDIPFLLGCFLLVMATTLLARVAGLVLFPFALGVFSQTGYLFLVTPLFGGDASAVAPLLILTLKVTYNDGLFLAISFLVVAVVVLCSTLL